MRRPETEVSLWAQVAHVLTSAVGVQEAAGRQLGEAGPVPMGVQAASRFFAARAPSISIADYLTRIQVYAKCSEGCCIVAMIYIDRTLQRNPHIPFNSHTVHRYSPLSTPRLIIAAIVLAIKYNEDIYYDNDFYSRIGGISCEDMNQLEADMLRRIEGDLYVAAETYTLYFDRVREVETQ